MIFLQTFLLISVNLFAITIPKPSDFDKVDFFLQTIGQGRQIHEIAGHTLLRMSDRDAKKTYVFNWGVFNFNDPGFIQKFLAGKMRYFADVSSMRRTLMIYKYTKRSLVEDKINLTLKQKQRLYHQITSDLLPENLYYDYHIFFVNCATKVRDHIAQALGVDLKPQFEKEKLNRVFRDDIRFVLSYQPLFAFGAEIIINGDADQPLTPWEHMFLPERLRHYYLSLNQYDDNGQEILNKKLLTPQPYILDFPNPKPHPISGTTAVGLFFILLGSAGFFTKKRWLIKAFFILFGLFSFVFSVVMTLLWMFSLHKMGWHNLNLMLFMPTDFLLILAAIKKKDSIHRWVKINSYVHLVFLAILVVLWLTSLSDQNIGCSLLLFGTTMAAMSVWIIKCNPLREKNATK